MRGVAGQVRHTSIYPIPYIYRYKEDLYKLYIGIYRYIRQTSIYPIPFLLCMGI